MKGGCSESTESRCNRASVCLNNKDTISLGISHSPDLKYGNNPNVPYQYNGRPVPRTLPVKLNSVDLPKFSGEDKADYEP